MEALIQALEAENEAKYGPDWRNAMGNEACWLEFRRIMRMGAAICIAMWVYVQSVALFLPLPHIPGWTLPAMLVFPAAFGWWWSLRHLR